MLYTRIQIHTTNNPRLTYGLPDYKNYLELARTWLVEEGIGIIFSLA